MYGGPSPKLINKNFFDHTYELITCLINGEQKKSLTNRYLLKFGFTREEYLKKFPGAPLLSLSAKKSYQNAALSEKGKKTRSDNITKLNLTNKEFQQNRKKSLKNFLNSNRSIDYRLNASKKAKIQHQNGLDDQIRNYFKTKYIGSVDQADRSKRMKENNPIHREGVKTRIRETYITNLKLGLHNKETKFKKRKFKNTNLIYQSTYEKDFLLLCESLQILDKIQNSPCFTDKSYPYNYYQPDYIFDNQYIIEIKSWYVEKLQEKKYPGIINLKKELIKQRGYNFVYIKDKDYTEFKKII